ncbi:MAG: hypothetical protein JXR97_06180, partial [Planctomycetes bacterium]|nr:hypothetical protein [Planctomycetota bacterium]
KDFESADMGRVANTFAGATDAISKIRKTDEKKPLVGVVGEIYVRSDPFINSNLCRRIEELGGEAWLAPISEWILYTNHLKGLICQEQDKGFTAILKKVQQWLETNLFFEKVEHMYAEISSPVLHDRHEHPIAEVMELGMKYLPWQFEGEAVLTLGRAELFVKKDGAKAIVNASPMFCMPGTLTTGIFPKLEQDLNVPVICNFYDGSGDPNQALVPVMHYLCEDMKAASI